MNILITFLNRKKIKSGCILIMTVLDDTRHVTAQLSIFENFKLYIVLDNFLRKFIKKHEQLLFLQSQVSESFQDFI